jgi:hypothetical protein
MVFPRISVVSIKSPSVLFLGIGLGVRVADTFAFGAAPLVLGADGTFPDAFSAAPLAFGADGTFPDAFGAAPLAFGAEEELRVAFGAAPFALIALGATAACGAEETLPVALCAAAHLACGAEKTLPVAFGAEEEGASGSRSSDKYICKSNQFHCIEIVE